jgi:hypothetical protein
MRRFVCIFQLLKLCSHAVRGRVGQSKVPLFDCIIVVALKVEDQTNIPFLQLKYPQQVHTVHTVSYEVFKVK